ncbi:MAG: hypothetical protein JWM82_780, partial [Myxococcales bacterium]|nr:hypothetical protein [Myxococcales bacterium]
MRPCLSVRRARLALGVLAASATGWGAAP